MVFFALLPMHTSFAGDGSPPPNSIDVIVSPIQNVVPEVSVPPEISDPNTRLVLPPCVGAIKNDCVVSLEYSTGNGVWIKGDFVESMPLRNLAWKSDSYKEDFSLNDQIVFAKPLPSQNFPSGGRTSIWQLKGARHTKSDLYAVTISFPGNVSDRSNPRSSSTKIKWEGDLKIMIGTYNRDEPNTSRSCSGFFADASFKCEFVNVDKFPSNTKFRIKVNFQTTKSILENSPWLIGHLINSKISSISQSDGSKNLILEGSPTISGMVISKFSKNEDSYKTYKQALETLHKIYVGDKYPFEYSFEMFTNDQGSMNIGTSTPGVVEAWNIIEKLSPFNYVDEEDIWLVQNTKVSPSDSAILESCNIEKISNGLLATNALGANPRPPIYDSVSKELIYTVASPHLKKNGALNVGFYEISIDQKLAECLWGKDSLKYQATVNVVSLDGVQKVTTVNVAVRDGFITFRATGFTYSANKIKVKMGNENSGPITLSELTDFAYGEDQFVIAGSNSIQTDSPVIDLKKSKNSTITCVKGKATKKITSISPKCPAGYKKK